MPPEPLPFDRKDFFKERKPSSSDPAGVVPVRWRETPTTPSSHPNNHGPFSYRCGGAGGSSDFRRPFSGHRKQVGGGWHVTTVEPWQDKYSQNRDNNNHCNGGNFRETTASPNDNSHLQSDFINSWDQVLPKDQHDKTNGVGVGTTGVQKLEKENSLGSSIDWKPLKWSRSGSLASRGSGFSHSKSIGVDSVDTKTTSSLPGHISPLQSPSEEAATCLTPRTPADDASSRKKARLGWGEGLAKYEKKKVGPDDVVVVEKEAGTRNGVVEGGSSLEPLHPSPCSQLDKSPSLTGCSDCASPATPYSFACSSSPGLEEKASVKAAEVDNDICDPSHHDTEFNLENLELTEAANMTSLLNELLQSEETSTQASGFLKSTAMDKLHVWKANISRTLEITESEIDSLENESKSLVSHLVGASSSFPSASGIFLPPTEYKDNMSTKKADDDCVTEEEEHDHTVVEDLDRDSPGTATSKFTSCDNHAPLDTISENTEAKCPQDDVSNGGDVHYKTEDKFRDLFASNKVDANESHDELANLLLPSSQPCINSAASSTNMLLVKERFTMKKRFLKFKEKVTTLKFRAFQYVWKEDLRLLSVRKSGSKSHKKFESSSRFGFADYQKHRSSIRSRFSSPAGNLSLVPTTEITDYANKLLCDSETKIYRNTLKMPSLILDKSERVSTRFISDNGLVEDPCEVEKERSRGNHWTPQEKEIFLEKFSLFGKDFKKISSFLDQKTVADCVEFYYKNHKSEVFQKTKKHPEFAKQAKSTATNTYLVTSGKRWSNSSACASASLDILGAVAADVEGQSQSQRKCTPKLYIGTSKRSNGGSVIDERETAAADVLAGICGSISSEALSSCITSLVDSADVYHNKYSSRRHVSVRDDVAQNHADEETCSDDSCEMTNHSDWTDGEKSSFLEAVKSYGKDFTMISRCLKTRSRDECKVFYSKGRKCLGLDQIHVDGKIDDHNHDHDDGHGHDDACMLDSGSVISCEKSSSEIKMEVEDLHSSDSKQQVVESDNNIVVNEEEGPQIDGAKLEVDTANCLDLEKPSCDNGFVSSCMFPPVHRKTHSQDDISSTRLSFRKSGRSSSTDGYHLHLPKHSLMDCVESSQSQVLKGYPVTITTPSLQICTTTLTQKQQPSGDVKLFGQILTKPKVNNNSNLQENGEKKSVGKSYGLKFDNHNHNNGNGGVGDMNLSLSEVPLKRSYGYWDGNRIQTGFPSLPDPSMLLAKYPAAFGNSVYSYKKQEVGVSDPVAAIRMHYAKTEQQYNNGTNGAV